MSDGDALLAAIVAHPDDDTPRLIYADWLQENGDEARAEFIRVQCKLAPFNDAGHGLGACKPCPVLEHMCKNRRPGGQVLPKCAQCEEASYLEWQCDELLAVKRDVWQYVPCPTCHPTHPNGKCGCPNCDATGDATRRYPAKWVWRRGWAARAQGRLADLFYQRKEHRYVVKPWAQAVARAHPLLSEWRIADREPLAVGTADHELWIWYNSGHPSVIATVLDLGSETDTLPDVVFTEMKGHKKTTPQAEAMGKLYKTRDDAHLAADQAVGRIVRRAVREAAKK